LNQMNNLRNSIDPVYKNTYDFLYHITHIFEYRENDFENIILEARNSSFGGLLNLINWMRCNLGHDPSDSWLPIISELEKIYHSGGMGPRVLKDLYCPKI